MIKTYKFSDYTLDIGQFERLASEFYANALASQDLNDELIDIDFQETYNEDGKELLRDFNENIIAFNNALECYRKVKPDGV